MKYILTILASLSVSCSVQQRGSTVENGKEEWQSLFNGKDMSHWRVYREDDVRGWEVENGIMIATGKEHADIISKEQYDDFELELEWNISSESNSGIFFNVREGADYGAVYMTGPEYQLLDDAAYEGRSELQMSAANYDVHPPSTSVAKAAGSWNKTKLLVKGNHVEHWLNGVKTVEYKIGSDDWKDKVNKSKWKDVDSYAKYPSGHVALQDHGGVIKFRNIRIREL